jgi:SNF2 family DNA or RNA helicase
MANSLKPLWTGFSYKPHQVTGVKWMLDREKESPSGGTLCDEMGLGKTIQMMGLLKETGRSETLLIAPVAVLDQWEAAARRSHITVFRPHVTGRYVEWRHVTPVLPGAARLHLIGYESAKIRKELTVDRVWDRIICDEAHRAAAKNGFYTMVSKLVAPKRWFLTATPIVNGLGDLVNLLTLLGVEKPKANLVDLEDVLDEVMLARSMDDLRASIPDAPPPPVQTTLTLDFATEEEGEFYRGMCGVIVRRWKALAADGGATLMRLQLFLRLRQLSLHPQIYIEARRKALGPLYDRPDWAGSSTKFEKILGLVRAEPRRWIIFCHFHPEMELLRAALAAEPAVGRVWSYSGALNGAERKTVLESTHEELPAGKAGVLLVQLQSGGTGLNLQHFDRIIFSGPWWTSALMEQAIGRAVRIGQREVVQVYHLVLKEEEAVNIDKVMRDKAESKGDLCRVALEMACRDI